MARRDELAAFVSRATSLETTDQAPPGWGAAELAGRLVELSGIGAVASLTGAVGLVQGAQERGDPVAWISLRASSFFPPDVEASGVDLEALAVVRVPAPLDAARAAQTLIRSGAFGLVVLDLGAGARVPTPLQGRLVNLAQRHDCAVVCLTEKSADAGSLGSMVSLRAEVARTPEGGDRFRCVVKVLKDKRRGPGWSRAEVVRGPDGLR